MNEREGRSSRLVVLVPGFYGHGKLWGGLRARLEEEPGYRPEGAHWLALNHGSRFHSYGGLRALAKRLRARIDAEWIQTGGFDDVVLVGHSMGGALVREIYLLAAGAVPGETGSAWTERVSRFVLVASVNRGIDTQRLLWLRPIAWLARNVRFVARFRALDLYRGSAFLTNLRINWIRHFGALAAAVADGKKWSDDRLKCMPCVVQLLGTKDGLVSADDSKDVLALQRGHDLTVPDANHRDIFTCEAAPDPELRWAVLRSAFCDDFDESPPLTPAAQQARRVVFLLHGIRASNVDGWIKRLERAVVERDPAHTVVKHPTYGYFSAARFTLPSVRRKNIAVFQDWYTEVLADHPTAEFDIIAHSNGSYILGQSLLATPGMKFEQVVLAGSVLPRDFWQRFGHRLKEQVGRIRNDRANRDWPVALLCSALRGLFQRDVGTGGFAGFNGDATHEVAYFQGGHGEALKPEFHGSMVDFIFGATVDEPDDLIESPGSFRQLSNAAPILTVLVVIGLLFGAAAFVLSSWPVGWDMWHRAALLVGGLGVVYVFLDIL